MLVRTSMGSESQGATKIMSGFTDPRVYSSMKIMTLDMYMNAMNHVLSVSPSFLSSVVTMSTSRLTGVYMTNNSCQESVLEDTHCKEEEQYDSEFEDDEWPVFSWIYQTILPLGQYCWDLWKNLDSANISATCRFAIFIALWNVRLPRNMCMEIKYTDSGLMNGAFHHHSTNDMHFHIRNQQA